MKKHLLLLALLFAGVWTIQAQTLNWAAAFGGSTYAAGKAIATDLSGNVYSTGYFYGSSDFDPSLAVLSFTAAPNFGCDLYISKLNADATLGWAKQIGSDGNDNGSGIAVDQTTGDVYVTGWIHGPTDFDPGVDSFIVNAPAADAMFVLKLDAAGDFLWARTLEGSSSYGLAIALDNSGNVVVSGQFDGTVDFDPGAGIENATAAGQLDCFVLKLDASGNRIFDFQFGGAGYDEAFAMDIDGSGNIYVTGGFDGTIDLDPGTGTTNYTADGSDIFVSKFDNLGSLVWGLQMGGPGNEFCKAVGVDASGNVYMTGKFSGTVDFDPSAGSTSYAANGFSDAFLTRLDANGNLIWATKVGGAGLDEGTALTIDADGGIVWTGGFQDTVDFEIGGGITNLDNELGTDIFVAKYNPDLSFAWAKNMGGIGTNWGYAIALDGNDNVCLTGQFTDQCDFDPNAGTANLTSLGDNDIFVMTLGLPAVSREEMHPDSEYSVYPNPTTGMLRIQAAAAGTLSIVNALGQEMLRVTADSQELVDVSRLDAGIYFVVDSQTGRTAKFIKQ